MLEFQLPGLTFEVTTEDLSAVVAAFFIQYIYNTIRCVCIPCSDSAKYPIYSLMGQIYFKFACRWSVQSLNIYTVQHLL